MVSRRRAPRRCSSCAPTGRATSPARLWPPTAASTPPGSGCRRCGGEGEGRASPGEFTRVGADGSGTHGATYGVHTSSSGWWVPALRGFRSEEHTSELQSLMRRSYARLCLKKKKVNNDNEQCHTKKN